MNLVLKYFQKLLVLRPLLEKLLMLLSLSLPLTRLEIFRLLQLLILVLMFLMMRIQQMIHLVLQ